MPLRPLHRFRRWLVPILALTLSPLTPAATPACFDEWIQSRLDAAMNSRRTVDALLPLHQVAALRRTASDPQGLLKTLEEISQKPDTLPLVASEIDLALLDAAETNGDRPRAEALAQRLGLVRQFLVAGPFKPSMVPPDLIPALGRTEDGPAAAIRWRKVTASTNGILPLVRLMTPPANGLAAVVFYLKAEIATDVALRIGSDDTAELRLNGQQLIAPGSHHNFSVDQAAAFVRLDPGWHRVELRVEQEDGNWAAMVRLTDPQGKRLPPGSVSATLPDDRAAVEKALLADSNRFHPIPGQTLPLLLENAAENRGPLGKGLLALDLDFRNLPSRAETRAVDLGRQAAAAAPSDPDLLWVQAEVDSDPARRREALEKILILEPNHPAALRRLVSYHLDFGRLNDSLAEARRSLAACGRPDPYLETWAALARDSRGFAGGATATVSRVSQAFPRQPVVLARLADLQRREGLSTSAQRTLQRLVALEPGNDSARSDLISLLSTSPDQQPEIERLIQDGITLAPLDPAWRIRLCRFLLTEGRLEEGLQANRAALEIAPGNPTLLELLGELQLAAGKPQAAEAAWKEALANAQDPGTLGERITALTGADDTFGSEWTVTLDEARALENRLKLPGDTPSVTISKTVACRIRPDGLSSRFQQRIIRILHPDQADDERAITFSYTPSLERATVVDARVVRRDGTVLLASRNERPLLPDLEYRMYYDTQIVQLSFPRFEEGDLIDVRWRISDRGPGNQFGEGYFGNMEIMGDDQPVLAARLILDAPPERPLRHKLVNLPAPATERQETRDNRNITVVTLPPLSGYQGAPLGPPPTAKVPYTVIGTLGDWNELGRFYAQLLKEPSVPGPDLRDLVQRLVKPEMDRKTKIRTIYDWVIENTRYVALEFGINAVKPYAVNSVLRRRFGDCKDKGTLLAAMLREAGIDARVAMVRTRDRGPIDLEIPTFAAFDHVIVNVPQDGLWLDGTVMHHGLGEIPPPDRNVPSLVVDTSNGGGGVLVTIPEMAPEEDWALRDETIVLNPEGEAQIDAEVTARGNQAAEERSLFRNSDRPYSVLGNRLQRVFPELEVQSAAFEKTGLDDPEVHFSWKGRMPRFARREADGLSAPLGLVIPDIPLDRVAPDRTIPVYLPPPFRASLITRLTVPPAFRSLELPSDARIDSPWAALTLEVQKIRNRVEIHLDLIFRGGQVPPERLPELREFIEKARHALDGRILMRP